MVKPIYQENGNVYIIDQTLLPVTLTEVLVTSAPQMYEAIRSLRVRGAPAIGIACAMGVYLGVKTAMFNDQDTFQLAVTSTCEYLCAARPTAVNLFWAAARMKDFAYSYTFITREAAIAAILSEAQAILDEDMVSCYSIGLYAADLLRSCKGVLTHCNAGALATSAYGTATAGFYVLHEQGHHLNIYADETRPLLQGSRLTAWELSQAGMDVTVITDSMAGVVMRNGWVDAVITGADRITSNGDAANKIGTYSLSVLAKEHEIPFYVAAPFSSVDFSLNDGNLIPIEQRGVEEVSSFGGKQVVPQGVRVFNPSFDVTPSKNITAIITDRGVVRSEEELKACYRTGVLRYQ